MAGAKMFLEKALIDADSVPTVFRLQSLQTPYPRGIAGISCFDLFRLCADFAPIMVPTLNAFLRAVIHRPKDFEVRQLCKQRERNKSQRQSL
jgi:hypothetical protein